MRIDYSKLIGTFPTERERKDYASSASYVNELSATYERWTAALPEGYECVFFALLSDGSKVLVQDIAASGFNSIEINGTSTGKPCLIIAHQSSVQFICVAEKIQDAPKTKVGFIS